MSGRLLVLGARGLVGEPLLTRLAAEGRRPLALSRRPRGPDGRADWVVGDLQDERLEDSLPRLSGVISLCPIWALPAALPVLARRGARRLIAFSSTSRFTKARSQVASEREVARRLTEGEAGVLGAAARLGLAATVLRPTMIYLEGRDGNVSRLAALIRRVGVVPLWGAGSGRRQPVHADDLAGVALLSLDRPQTAGRSYDLPGGETLTYREMTERIFRALGRRPRIIAAPPWVWEAGLAALGPLLPGATKGMGVRMGEDLVFDGADARRDLDWRPRSFDPRFPGRGDEAVSA